MELVHEKIKLEGFLEECKADIQRNLPRKLTPRMKQLMMILKR